MEFLPLRIEGQRVYAGFWKRFCAGIVDLITILPIVLLFNYIGSFDKITAIFIIIWQFIFFTMYTVYFHARFGGTIGKLAVKIRIRKPDGSSIGWKEAWKRFSVNLVFSFVSFVVVIWALIQVDFTEYSSAGFIDRSVLLVGYYPAWHGIWQILTNIWVWSEALVCLFNRRRRAIHDFIGGTVVVHKRALDQIAAGYDSEKDSPEESVDEQKFLAGMWS
jgi:uncharacterized RDD family membrane protein YckC